jgi:hypothetical protein
MQHSPSTSSLKRGLDQLSKIWALGGVLSIVALGMDLANTNLPFSADTVGGLALTVFVFATAFVTMRQPLGYRPEAVALPIARPRYANKPLGFGQEQRFANDRFGVNPFD